MTAKHNRQQAVTPKACPEKVAGLLSLSHLELIRAAQQALHRAIAPQASSEDRARWFDAAADLAVALVARLESIEEASQ